MGNKIRDINELPQDVAVLRRMVMEQADKLDARDRYVKRLQHMLAKLLRWRYGPRREKVDENQLLLFALEMVEKGQDIPSGDSASDGKKQKKHKHTPHGRQRIPEHLERREVIFDVPEEERHCPHCSGEMKHIGDEVSEQIEFIPASLFVIREVSKKYACERGCAILTAQKPMRPIEKGLAGPGLLAHVAVGKYADHLPLHRQEEIFKRQGVKLARSTLCDWMGTCAELVRPLFDLMKERVMMSKAIQTDDTPVGVLDREWTRTRIGRLWTYVGDAAHPFTVYDYTPNRKRDGPSNFMEDFQGYLQADAYPGYDAIFNDPERQVTEVACWAHVRRKFFEAQSSDVQLPLIMLTYIRLLYEVEREARDLKLDGRGRYALRQARSVELLDGIHTYLKREQGNALPKSPEGQAISYTLSNWKALTRYCEDGDLEIDNNGAERSLRGVVIGRKNWMFFGSDRGGRTAAILNSLITSCKRNQVEPFAYLKDIFERISAHPVSRLEELLPDRWKELRPPSAS
ncbi:MAG: IS66 family transposase [Candidatus Erginobacter occultus]|nr:IS66 family transposase [Candidatus Erginobacter occultus]